METITEIGEYSQLFKYCEYLHIYKEGDRAMSKNYRSTCHPSHIKNIQEINREKRVELPGNKLPV